MYEKKIILRKYLNWLLRNSQFSNGLFFAGAIKAWVKMAPQISMEERNRDSLSLRANGGTLRSE